MMRPSASRRPRGGPASSRAAPAATRSPVPGWGVACFFVSGAAGLLYEVAWSKQLGYLLGNSLHASATVVAAFLGGLVVVLIATCSGIEAYGHVLEWMHMIEHLLLIMVAPVLLAIGSPLQLVAEALPPRAAAGWRAFLDRPVVGWLTSPPFAAAFYAVCVIGVHLTGLMDRAMADDGVHVHHDLTQEELAQLVGASRETVNKALADFASRGWLRLEARSVVLMDVERLKRRAR